MIVDRKSLYKAQRTTRDNILTIGERVKFGYSRGGQVIYFHILFSKSWFYRNVVGIQPLIDLDQGLKVLQGIDKVGKVIDLQAKRCNPHGVSRGVAELGVALVVNRSPAGLQQRAEVVDARAGSGLANPIAQGFGHLVDGQLTDNDLGLAGIGMHKVVSSNSLLWKMQRSRHPQIAVPLKQSTNAFLINIGQIESSNRHMINC